LAESYRAQTPQFLHWKGGGERGEHKFNFVGLLGEMVKFMVKTVTPK
jgi:hypothetical protein